MAPRKNAGPTPLVAALEDAGVTKPGDISVNLLQRIYRLRDDVVASRSTLGPVASSSRSSNGAQTSPGAASQDRPPLHSFKACRNPWITPEGCQKALKSLKKPTQNKKSKYITIEDEDTEDESAGLDPDCSPAKCKDNPRCLNWLGQALWEADDAFEKFAKQWKLGDDPTEQQREPDLPVGLKNLGATCYVNSFLQVWFRDGTFRRGVFSCKLDPGRDLVLQPLYHLQVTFAALQEGETRAFNPVDLAKALNIDMEVQQDAQEFGKLLMNLLEEQFKNQTDPKLTNLLADQFEGKVLYGTECNRCGQKSERTTSFKEWDISPVKDKSLEQLLSKSLEPECLSGDNKYKCEPCGQLRNASRYTHILELPPVLHFSVLRFGYDFDKGERTKSAVFLTFPQSIDMSYYMKKKQGPVWYDLRGVLLHKGNSAYHGHYIAQIYDTRTCKITTADLDATRLQQWFEFDDETVSPLSFDGAKGKGKGTSNKRSRTPTPAGRSYAETKKRRSNGIKFSDFNSSDGSDSPVTVSAKSAYGKSRLTPPRAWSTSQDKKHDEISDDDEESAPTRKTIRSKDAYMLVYARREAPEAATPGPSNQAEGASVSSNPIVPDLAKQRLQELDQEMTQASDRYNAKFHACRTDFERVQQEKRSVYTVWNAYEDAGDCVMVDQNALADWLSAEILEKKKNKKKAAEKTRGTARLLQTVSSDTEDSDCVEVTSVAVKRDERSNGQASSPASRKRLDTSKQDTSSSTKRSDDNAPAASGSPKKNPALTSPSTKATNGVFSLFPPVEESDGAGQKDKKTDRQDRSVLQSIITDQSEMMTEANGSELPPAARMPSVRRLHSTGALCMHGRLSPEAAASTKRVDPAGMKTLISLGVDIEPMLLTRSSLCELCAWEPYAASTYLQSHKMQVSEFKDLEQGHGNAVWISSAWLNDWKKDRPSMHGSGGECDPSPADVSFFSDVMCDHGYLQPDSSLRDLITERQSSFLKSLFPDWYPPARHTSECPSCLPAFQERLAEADHLKKIAKAERMHADLRALTGSKDEVPREPVATRQGEEFWAIPHSWFISWHRWVKRPEQYARPGQIQFEPFLCQHGNLKIDMTVLQERKKFQLLSERHWKALSDLYTADLQMEGILLRSHGRNGEYDSVPETCLECRARALADLPHFTIEIRFLREEDMDESGDGPKKDCTNTTEADARSRTASPLLEYKPGIRRSTRTQKAPGNDSGSKKARRESKNLKVQRGDTLKDIRIEIEAQSGIPIIYQRVFFNGRELDNAAETVDSIGIVSGQALQVLEIEARDDIIDFNSLQDHVPRSKQSNGRSEGFQGTSLSGAPSKFTVEIKDGPFEDRISCPHCTFLTLCQRKTCEVCESNLY